MNSAQENRPLRTRASLGFLGGFLGVLAVGTLVTPNLEVRWLPAELPEYTPPTLAKPVDEVVLVFITSPSCAWSRVPELEGDVRAAKKAVWSFAHEADISFATVGVSVGFDAMEGIAFLRRFGYFDEITSGGGWWRNSGAVRYVHQDVPGVASTPQVLVIRRFAVTAGAGTGFSEELLGRFVGAGAIRDWVAGGLRLPPIGE